MHYFIVSSLQHFFCWGHTTRAALLEAENQFQSVSKYKKLVATSAATLDEGPQNSTKKTNMRNSSLKWRFCLLPQGYSFLPIWAPFLALVVYTKSWTLNSFKFPMFVLTFLLLWDWSVFYTFEQEWNYKKGRPQTICFHYFTTPPALFKTPKLLDEMMWSVILAFGSLPKISISSHAMIYALLTMDGTHRLYYPYELFPSDLNFIQQCMQHVITTAEIWDWPGNQ